MNLTARITRFVVSRRFVLLIAFALLGLALLLASNGHGIAAGVTVYVSVVLAFLAAWHGLMTAGRPSSASRDED